MTPVASELRVLPEEPAWPDSGGRQLVFLLDASSGLERRLLESWIERSRPENAVEQAVLSIPTSAPATRTT